jgi:hypothetical protein
MWEKSMTGFIRGFFGRKDRDDAAEQSAKKAEQPKKVEQPAKRVVRDRPSNAVFLEADDARGLGNVEYMRTSKTIRRTFPKTLNGEEREVIQKISALEKAKAAGDTAAVSALTSDLQRTVQSAGSVDPEIRKAAIEEVVRSDNTERRAADTSLDMFRNMARDIRKSK